MSITFHENLKGLAWDHIRLSYVAPLYLNRPNATEVLSIFDEYAQYPAEILDRVLFVLVDDGSPQTYQLKDWPLNMIVLRVGEDIPWNNPGARNLGMLYAKSDKVFITDIDHQLDPESFRKILKLPECGRNIWRLPRFVHDGTPMRSHANTFILSRGNFLRYFGYDEELCGSYACDDTLFSKFVKYHGMRMSTLKNGAKATVRDLPKIPGASTHTLDRDMSRNKAIVERKLDEIWQYGSNAGHSRQFLNFEWKVVRVTRRAVPPPEAKQPLWAAAWWGRWLLGER